MPAEPAAPPPPSPKREPEPEPAASPPPKKRARIEQPEPEQAPNGFASAPEITPEQSERDALAAALLAEEDDAQDSAVAEPARASDLYLDTVRQGGASARRAYSCSQVNRNALDFDFEKLCSVCLSNVHIYGCLVCGKYFQGRGKSSYAYAHSVHEDHHVFINLETGKVRSSRRDVNRLLSTRRSPARSMSFQTDTSSPTLRWMTSATCLILSSPKSRSGTSRRRATCARRPSTCPTSLTRQASSASTTSSATTT